MRVKAMFALPLLLLAVPALAQQTEDAFEQALRQSIAPARRSPPKAPPRVLQPAATAQGPALNPLAGMMRVSPHDIADAVFACASVARGGPIDPAALHRIGWASVRSEEEGMQLFARPSSDLTIKVGSSGDAAAACSTSGMIGDAASGAALEQLLSRRFGPSSPATRLALSRATVSWRTADAEIIADIAPLMRGGPHRAHIFVVPHGVEVR